MKSRKPTPLADLQTQFLSDVIKGETTPEFARGHFNIYQDAYRLRIRGVIEDDFSKSLSVLAKGTLDSLFTKFFSCTFSSNFTLTAIGYKWVDFIKGQCSADDLSLPPYFSELTNFEWKLTIALYHESSAQAAKKDLSLDTLMIRLAPALSIFESQWPVHKIYESAHYDSIEESSEPYQIAVWREHEQSRFTQLSDLGARLLKGMLHSTSVHVSLDELSAADPAELETVFSELTQMGVLSLP